MRRRLIQAFIGIGTAALVIVATAYSLIVVGVIGVTIMPNYYYRFDERERAILNGALALLHERMRNGDYESVRSDLVEGRISKDDNIAAMRNAVSQFGGPIDSEFFRSSPPEPASKYYPELNGTIYTVYYFTKTNAGDYHEHIDWNIDDSGHAKIRSYSASKIIQWQEENREREEILARKFSHSVEIPVVLGRLEVHY